jgi:hypothetical protein
MAARMVVNNSTMRADKLITSGLWAILPLALFQWLVAWCLRYLPANITSTLARLLLLLSVALCLVSVPVAQIIIYRSLTKTYDLRKDGYFLAVFFAEHIISLVIIFLSASKRAGNL